MPNSNGPGRRSDMPRRPVPSLAWRVATGIGAAVAVGGALAGERAVVVFGAGAVVFAGVGWWWRRRRR